MNVLVACEYSGRVRDAFKAKGHNAWSCDLLPTEVPGQHYQCSIEDVIYKDWDMLIAHPPCTYLTNSGVRWLDIKEGKIHNLDRLREVFDASRFFKMLYDAPIKYVCVENPIPHKYASIPKYTQIVQPWQFGHEEMKATCLWLKGLHPLKPTNIVGPPPKDPELKKKWAVVHRASPGPDRWKDRSRTKEGIAEAMAEQWG